MARSVRLLISTLALALVVPAAAAANDRPVVQVRFVIVDATYKLKFGAAVRPAVEAAAAARLAQQLAARIGFIGFTAQNGPDIVLTFELDRQDPSSIGDVREVGFHVKLHRQGQPVGDRVYVMFRPQTESLAPIPDRDALIEAIGPKVAEAAAPRGPITALLSAIPIARQALLIQSPLGWVIPYQHADLCMDEASVVRLSNTVDSPVATVVREFTAKTSGRSNQGESRGRIFSEPDPVVQEHLDDLKNTPTAQIRVDAVYVVRYSPRTPCEAAVAPVPRLEGRP
jgi:hypothetical protein